MANGRSINIFLALSYFACTWDGPFHSGLVLIIIAYIGSGYSCRTCELMFCTIIAMLISSAVTFFIRKMIINKRSLATETKTECRNFFISE